MKMLYTMESTTWIQGVIVIIKSKYSVTHYLLTHSLTLCIYSLLLELPSGSSILGGVLVM